MSLSLMYYDIVSYVVILCFFMCIFTIFYLFSLGLMVGDIVLNKEYNSLEFNWTFLPSILIGILCYFNLSFVYFDSELDTQDLVKVMGRQWYWSYEDSFKGVYDSYYTDSLVNSVDNPLVLNYNKSARILISSSDVLHSFSVPALGLKMDAVPGRVNHLTYLPDRLGSFVGYCSELCGVGHSFMPNHY
uniref:Cytochrome c oxidase subunit 2 n=1 Tax=Gyrodactylus bueni TaxID=1448046 RepID=E3SXE4_9PLAT|nr:cytochrome c oxidase subunit II [Gyrodactylus bueni]ADP24240.1 cytochrome c oxidase subunit II [Gyrodactylus bueni]QCX36168.1 cytochrome c oxidase subunit II [Gyrodactylus bueni]